MLSYNNYNPNDREKEYVGNLLNIEPNDISYMFFSDKNVNYINEQLIENIKEITFKRYGKVIVIQPQRKHIVIAIMRHIYFTNVKNALPATEEVILLNKETLRRMTKVVIRELIAYIRYINDFNSIVPLELPKQDSRKQGNTAPFSNNFDFKY